MINFKPIELYADDNHSCIMFNDLVTGHGVQANQFLIVSNGQSILLDPGGDLTYMPLTIAAGQVIKTRNLSYIFASHQDPDIIASIDRWLMNTSCKVIISKLWGRFLPHLVSTFVDQHGADIQRRIIEIDDPGQRMRFGKNQVIFLPAHFLHSVGNFQLYDPISKILFSGDMGASIFDSFESIFVEDFAAHIPSMQGFHERYMVSRKVTGLWANMIRELDVEMIVPQHGKAFKGQDMVNQFLNWVAELDCGIDLFSGKNYKIPIV
ncbi:CDP-abequose synthase (Fragment) [hydrothermal vent metagenome]|uniref:CDP-abequose synthase n=1 Tax=hydrothermal vent metagenome TaxID=652676 RepID=A0A3B0VLV5_9ZZZZ